MRPSADAEAPPEIPDRGTLAEAVNLCGSWGVSVDLVDGAGVTCGTVAADGTFNLNGRGSPRRTRRERPDAIA